RSSRRSSRSQAASRPRARSTASARRSSPRGRSARRCEAGPPGPPPRPPGRGYPTDKPPEPAMTDAANALLQQAMALSPEERYQLAEHLLDSLGGDLLPDDPAFDAEIARRSDE